jgi:hypothetical protein
MKNFVGYIALSLTFILPLAAFAMDIRVGENPSVSTNELITNDVYMAGASIMSAGNIEGDLVAGGGTILVSNPVSGDAILGGGNITILSDIGDDVRVTGGNIIVHAGVGGDMIAAGGQIILGGAGVQGDVAIAAGSIRIDAPVSGDLKLAGGSIYINAPVSGDITIEGGMVTLGSNAVITSSLLYTAEKELTKEDGATVNGKVTFKKREDTSTSAGMAVAFFSVFVVICFLAQFTSTLLLGLLFKRFSKNIVTGAVERPLLELGRGLLTFAAVPVLSVLALITVIGIPIGIVGILSFILLLLLAWVIVPILVGSVVYRYFSKGALEVTWKTALIGVFVYTIIGIIPFIGGLAQGLLLLLTLGTIVAVKWDALRHWR